MSIIAFLPILIMIIIAITFGAFIKKNSTPKVRYMTGKPTRFFIYGYASILLIALIVYYLLPTQPVEGNNNLYDMQALHQEIYTAASEGKIDQINEKYKNRKLEFAIPGEQLTITPTDPYYDITIFAERKDTNDGKIEVMSITTPLIIEGIDYTNTIKTLGISLDGDRLTLIYPEPTEIKLAVDSKEFTISQFTEDLESYNIMEPIFRNTGIIYMEIPKDLQITNENEMFLQYVGS